MDRIAMAVGSVVCSLMEAIGMHSGCDDFLGTTTQSNLGYALIIGFVFTAVMGLNKATK